MGFQPLNTNLPEVGRVLHTRHILERAQRIIGVGLVAVDLNVRQIQPHIGDILMGGVCGQNRVQLRVFRKLFGKTGIRMGVGIDHADQVFVQLLHTAQTEVDIDLPLLHSVLQTAVDILFQILGGQSQEHENTNQR